MTTTTVFPNYIINNYIEVNKYGVAIFNNTTLGIHRAQAVQTKCTGKIGIVKDHIKFLIKDVDAGVLHVS